MLKRHNKATNFLNVAVAGKYVSIEDSYISICKAINDGSVAQGYKSNIEWVDTEKLETGNRILGVASYHNSALEAIFTNSA